MSEQPDTMIEDASLTTELDNREAITLLMELYGVDESSAEELWKKFIDAVKKTKASTEEEKEIAGTQS